MDSKTHQPEHKIGPFQDGIGVTIWKNVADDGTTFRSITINPRRFRDSQTGQWKDAKSFRPGDLRTVIAALEQALAYMQAYPVPSSVTDIESVDRPSRTTTSGRTESKSVSISSDHSRAGGFGESESRPDSMTQSERTPRSRSAGDGRTRPEAL